MLKPTETDPGVGPHEHGLLPEEVSVQHNVLLLQMDGFEPICSAAHHARRAYNACEALRI